MRPKFATAYTSSTSWESIPLFTSGLRHLSARHHRIRMRHDSGLLASHLLTVWIEAAEAEIALATREGRSPAHDIALEKILEAARPTCPKEGRQNLIDASVASLRFLERDTELREAIRRRGYSAREARIVEQRLREITSGADSGGSHEAQAVIAGMIGRLYGPEQRIAYLVGSVLDPALEDDDSEEAMLETTPESSHHPAMTHFEERFSKILYTVGGFLVVLFGTMMIFSGGSLVSDLFRYGWQDFWTMIDVPGISTNRDLHAFVRYGARTLAGIACLAVRKYLRGESRGTVRPSLLSLLYFPEDAVRRVAPAT
jgi:hypothetical protein